MSAAAEWRARIDAWAASGKSCREFAAKAGLKPATLAWWKWRLGQEPKGLGRSDFVEVAAPRVSEPGVIELEVAGATLRIRGRVEPEALMPVLQALEGRRC